MWCFIAHVRTQPTKALRRGRRVSLSICSTIEVLSPVINRLSNLDKGPCLFAGLGASLIQGRDTRGDGEKGTRTRDNGY